MGKELVRRALSGARCASAALLLLASAGVSSASGLLRLQVFAGEAKDVIIEVVPAGPAAAPAWRGDLGRAGRAISLPPGTYRAYIEDQKTGTILAFPEGSSGAILSEGESVLLVADLRGALDEVRRRERDERSRRESPKDRSHIEGELLIRFAPTTGLAQRQSFFAELGAEPRRKIRELDLYRTHLPEASDLDRVIREHGNDPRVLYIEKNQVMSVPNPPLTQE